MASELGIDIGEFVSGSTHGHAGPETYGSFGGIPVWYRYQIRDTAIASAKQAVANLRPATITVGEARLPGYNQERRDLYYSNMDTGATWIQAKTLPIETTTCTDNDGAVPPGEGPDAVPSAETGASGIGQTCTTSVTEEVIATWLTYAAHPVIVLGVRLRVLHADWPGASARLFEALYGGVGLVFSGGLGNGDPTKVPGDAELCTAQKRAEDPFPCRDSEAENFGAAIAGEIGSDIARGGKPLESNDMTARTRDIAHPVTNWILAVGLGLGLLDREFVPGSKSAGPPAAYHWSRKGELSTSGEDNDPAVSDANFPEFARGCTSSGPTVITTAGAHRIGEMAVAFAPGEIFSNVAEVVKERADRTHVTVVLGLMNDYLGYLMQSFEYDSGGGVVGEDVTHTGEYEEGSQIDRCFGDHVLETILESTNELGAGR